MSELITIGLNKNKKSFKPRLGKNNKRLRNNPAIVSTSLKEDQQCAEKKKASPIKKTLTTPSVVPLPPSEPLGRIITRSANPVTISTSNETQTDNDNQHSSKTQRTLPIHGTGVPLLPPLTRTEPLINIAAGSSNTTTSKKVVSDFRNTKFRTLVKQTERRLNTPPPLEWDDKSLPTPADRKKKLSELATLTKGVLTSKKSPWSSLETQVFYDGLAEFGLDFAAISSMIPGRGRAAVKSKYLKEERLYPNKITEYLLSKPT